MSNKNGIMSCSAIRASARRHLKGHWHRFFLLMLIVLAASSFLSLNSLTGYVMSSSTEGENLSLLVAHTSGLSWDGELPYSDAKQAAEGYTLQEFIQSVSSSRSYTPNDFIRTVEADGLVGVLTCLPSGFWLVFLFLCLVSMMIPMMEYGITVCCKKRMRGEDFRAGNLFCWKMLLKCVVSALILYVPGNLLRSLAKGAVNYPLVSLLALAATLFFVILDYAFSMRYYIWIDSPDMGLIAALRESHIRMKGHKFRLFVLQLTFIGWDLLYLAVSAVITFIVSMLSLPDVAAVMAVMVMSPWLMIYKTMSEMVFFDNICHPSEADAEFDDDEGDEGVPAAESGSVHVRTADEAAAWALLSSHNYSCLKLKEEGLWEEYQALDVHPAVQTEWLKKYSRFLCDEYDTNPTLLDDILRFSGEYGDTFSMTRVMNVLGRTVDFESQSPQILLEQCAKIIGTVNSGSFDDQKRFLKNAKERVADMADRLEFRLEKADPDGSWRETLATIREGCADK